MSELIGTVTGNIMFPNETLKMPVITKGRNGHVHRPKEFPSGDYRSTFGRGHDGIDKADEEISAWLQKTLDKMNWPNPTGFGNYTPSKEQLRKTHLSWQAHWEGIDEVRNGMEVWYWHPVWGYVVLWFQARDYELKWRLFASRPAKWWLERKVTGSVLYSPKYFLERADKPYVLLAERITNNPSTQQRNEAINEFIQNPFEAILHDSGPRSRQLLWAPVVDPGHEPTICNLEYSGQSWQHIETRSVDLITPTGRTRSETEILAAARSLNWIHIYSKDNIRKKLHKSRSDFNDLVEAFEGLGVKFGVYQDYQGPDMETPIITGFYMHITGDGETPGREYDHRITVRDNDVTVACGYLQDEEKSVEYERRRILRELQNVTEEMTETVYEMGDTIDADSA